MRRAVFLALVLAVPFAWAADPVPGQELGVDVRVWYETLGGARPNLRDAGITIEFLDLTSGTRLATDDALTRSRICRSGDTTDVCVPPGGDAFDPSVQHFAHTTFQPDEWAPGDALEVRVSIAGNLTTGVATATMEEGGLLLDVILVRPPDSIELTVFPSVQDVVPGDSASFTVRLTSHRPVVDTIDLTFTPAPMSWSATLAGPSAVTLAPGESHWTTLTVTSPPATTRPYSPFTQPERIDTVVTATPQGDPLLVRTATAQTRVPLLLSIAFDEADPFLVFEECRHLRSPIASCYPDPFQQVGFTVRATWVDGSRVPGVDVHGVVRYVQVVVGVPTEVLLSGDVMAHTRTTDANGEVRFDVPYNLPSRALPLSPMNAPGLYLVGLTATYADHRASLGGSYMVGPIT